MDWETIWRDFNTVFSGLALFLMVRRYVQYRHDWTFQERESLRALIMLLIGALVGSAWGVWKHFPFNIGMIFVTMGAVHAAQAALRKPARYVHEHDEGLSPSPDVLAQRIRQNRRRT